MSNYQELVTILKELLTNRFYPKPEYIRGLLGDGQGNVLVPERPDYNYVRFSRASAETFEVFNKEVSQPVDGWPVLIGSFPWQPNLVQVVATDWSAYAQTGWGDSVASIQAHAPTHEWPNFTPGSDPLNVYLRAITPMRTQAAASGSTSVIVTAYEYDGATGTNYNWPGLPPLSLQSATPATGTMRYMGVYLNPATNTLGVVSGSTTIFTDAAEPDHPAWPRGVYPSAYVRLYGGQGQIRERDIRDARRLWESTLIYTGAMGPHNLLSQFHSDTLTASVVAGDLIYGNSTPRWARLPIVTGSFLGSGAGTPAWSTFPAATTANAGVALKPIGVAAFHSTTQTLNNANAANVMELDSERRDDAGFHSNITDNTRLTVPTGRDGWYIIQGTGGFSADNTGTYRQIAIRIDGTTAIAQNQQPAPGSAQVLRINITAVYYLTAGQYVELVMSHNATTNLTSVAGANSTTEFRMVRVG